MSAGILDFEQLAEAYGDGIIGDVELEVVVTDALRAFEMAERNAAGLKEWQYLVACGAEFTDAARSPVEREIFDRWFATRRELAHAWLTRSVFFRRQV